MNILQRLWHDDGGFIVTSELILIATIAVLGMIVGLTTYRDQLVQEMGDAASAVSQLKQSYGYEDVEIEIVFGDDEDDAFCDEPFSATSFGSHYEDMPDFCQVDDVDGQPPACIEIEGVEPIEEGEELELPGGNGNGP